MYNKQLIIVLLFVLPSSLIYPQAPSYHHYTSADGLASSTVYDILQDKNGFIWFATANGVSKFDGNHFTTFRTSDGLNSNSIIALAEGKSGELYFGNYEKGINVLKNGLLQNYYKTDEEVDISISYLILTYNEENEQRIYAYKAWNAINILDHKTTGEITNTIFYTTPQSINKLALLKNGEMVAAATTGLYNYEDAKLTKLNIIGLPNTDFNCIVEGDNGSYFVGNKNDIYHISNNVVVKKYSIYRKGLTGVSHIFYDSHGNLWFSIMNKGFYFIPKGSDKIIDIGSLMDLQNTLVNNYLEDREGNIWISTFGKGVYCLNNLFIKTYNQNNGLSSNSIYSIIKDKTGKLIVGTFNGVNILEHGNFSQLIINNIKALTEYIYYIKIFDNDYYVGVSSGETRIRKAFSSGIDFHTIGLPSFCKTKGGLYVFGTSSNSIFVHRELSFDGMDVNQFYVWGDKVTLNRINDIYEDSEGNIWIAASKGICKISNLSVTNGVVKGDKIFFQNDQVLNSRINEIQQDRKGNVWFAGESGIASYNLSSDSVTSYTKISGYDLSSSTSIGFDNKDRLWIGNMKGLVLIEGNTIKFLNRATGLPSSEVLSLYYDDAENVLYAGTSNGIAVLDLTQYDLFQIQPPNVNVTNIQAGDSIYTNYDNLVFSPEQHDIKINFIALNFNSPTTVQYKYKFNDDWLTTDATFLNLIALSGGTYVLELMAKSQNTDWGKPTFITFRIQSRFTETLWFYVSIFLLMSLALLFVVGRRMRIKNKKLIDEFELSERINELKHQALSAMINPHFTFNALNSVQYLINSNRNEEANNYIAMMARLIRKNLDTAGKGFILLAEEIKRLKLYLDLEKLRFQENISYEIITGNDIDPELIMIPNMIIQPFVENSLWHGIINSGVKGYLTVSFTFEYVDYDSVIGKSLIIKITDNGIGINIAKKNKMEDHISKGIQIIEERLKLLSTKMQLPQPIMFEDLSSRNDNSQGTEVIISLPQSLYSISK